MDLRFLARIREELTEERKHNINVLAQIFTISWIVIITQGALRKWVFTGMPIVYLIQDVPIMIGYIYALRKGIVWVGAMMYFCIFISLFIFIQAFLQVLILNYNILTALVALHHYLFYLPMLFLIPACMTRANIRKFLRMNLYTILPMMVIVILQALSPRGAWINQTSAGEEIGGAFGSSATQARASGTFNFTLPFSIWCGVAAAMVIGEWLLPKWRRSHPSQYFLVANTLAIIVITALSGSRTAVFLVALAFLGALVAVFISRNAQLIARFSILLMAFPVFLALAYVVAPTSIDTLIGRFTEERATTEMVGRVEDMAFGFITGTDFNVIGGGIGSGIPAAAFTSRLIADDPYSFINYSYASEWDNVRTVQGLGSITGTFFVLSRYAACFLILWGAFRALLLPGDMSWPHALPFAFTILPTLSIGNMVHSAPVEAPQVYYCAAMVCSALLYRKESYESMPLPIRESAGRAQSIA